MRFAGDRMKRFVEGMDRDQGRLFPECLEDWIDENNPVRVIDVFVEEFDLLDLGFVGVDPEATGRPSYHPSVLLKLYIYGYLNRVQSSRRLEREAGLPDRPPAKKRIAENAKHQCCRPRPSPRAAPPAILDRFNIKLSG
jgi:hypothetical protein